MMHTLVVACLLLAPGAPRSVTVTGEVALASLPGDVARQDADGARARGVAEAKRHARRQALEKALGVAVSASTLVRNYQLVSDVVTTEVKGLILDERWGEPTVAGGIVKIRLTARVDGDALNANGCTVLRAVHDPRIAFLTNEGDTRGQTTSSLALELAAGCMTLVEPVAAHAADPLDDQAYLKGLQAQGADYALAVRAKGELMAARVIDLATNEIVVATEMADARAVADEVFRKLAVVWTRELVAGRAVQVKVVGLTFVQAKEVAGALAKAANVAAPRDVKLRDGAARFELEVPGGGRALAEIVDALAVLDGVVAVTAADAGSVSLVVRRR